jgi:hypothetical protein
VIAIYAEMYRSSGNVHRAVMSLPFGAIAVIVALSVYAHFNHDSCISIPVIQYWIQAVVNVTCVLLFWCWQRWEFLRVGMRLVDSRALSVVAAETPTEAVVYVIGGRRGPPIQGGKFILAILPLALVFSCGAPLLAGPLTQGMCLGTLTVRKVLLHVPVELMTAFMCTIFIVMIWVFQWAGAGFAVTELLKARTYERDHANGGG